MAGTKHAGIIDSEKKLLLDAGQSQESQKQRLADWASQQEQLSLYLQLQARNVGSVEAQMGRAMDYREFEKKLKQLPNTENLVFVDANELFKNISYKKPDGSTIYMSAYGKCLLPEWSHFMIEEEFIPDPYFDHANHLDYDLSRFSYDPLTGGYKKDPTYCPPGYKRVINCFGENPLDPTSRGWRGVLASYLQRAQASKLPHPSPEQIERKFGGDTSKASWAQHMGKATTNVPF